MSTNEPQMKHASTNEEELRHQIINSEARLAEIADLVARVRHEINNPLTGVIGQTQLLLRGELDDTARRRIETIEHLATRIRDIVARLRDVQSPYRTVGYESQD